MDVRGVDVQVSPVSFADTLERLRSVIEGRGLRVFGVIDHSAAASQVGLRLRPTTVLLFGSPAAGTPMMEGWPALALELPLRLAVWQGDDGQVVVAHAAAEALVEQFQLDPAKVRPLGVPAALVQQLSAQG